MAATVRDVAKKAGVSVSTVSVVVNGSKYVSPELKKRVEEAIHALEYVPNPLGRALSLKRTSTLAYIIPTITNPFYPVIIQAVEDAAFQRGYGLVICSTEGAAKKTQQYQSFLESINIDGLLVTLSSSLPLQEQYSPFIKRGIPIVGLAGPILAGEIDSVVTNDEAGMEVMTQHLLQLGHKRIAFLGKETSLTSRVRLQAVTRVLQAAGYDLPLHYAKLTADSSDQSAAEAAKQLFTLTPAPSAIICYNDLMAAGVLHTCHTLGLKVPQDVTVTGFDDTLGKFTSPPLTTMRVPADAMGKLAADILINRIESSAMAVTQVHRFTPELVVRESSAHV